KKFKTGLECHRPKIVINYMLNYQFKPSFIMDISGYYDIKMKAFMAYKSQFYRDYEKDVPTFINSKYFFDLITSRDKCYGLKIKAEYGEPYFIDSDLKIEDPVRFFDYLI
ncbi:MAG: bacillithiol biosynthesis deacetylase BshB1, partial [Actinobacteria bacterium]|nr:bacillithiol biosynthesis deacetylase BshB1 [Actinomycetota bacterium]